MQTITWSYIFSRIRRFPALLISAHIGAIVSALAAAPIPLLLPIIVDEVILAAPGRALPFLQQIAPQSWQHPLGYLLIFSAIGILLRIIGICTDILQSYQFIIIAKQVTCQLRQRILGGLRPVAMEAYESLGSGQVTSRLVTDMDTVDTFIGEGLSKFLIGVFSVVGVMAILFWIHPALAFFLIFLNPLVIGFTALLGKRIKKLKQHENQALESFQHAFTETLEAMQQIKVSNREQYFFRDLRRLARAIRDSSTRYAWQSFAGERLSSLLFMIGFDVFRGFALFLVIFSDLSIGQMFAVFSYLWFMLGAIQQIWQLQYKYFSASGALERINRLSDLQHEPQRKHADDHQRAQRQGARSTTALELELRNLYFRYPGAEKTILRAVNLQLEPGNKIAISGASGSGKSTLVQLIAGLYFPQRGDILLDGISTERLSLFYWREQIAVVLQHPALLNDTVRANLTLGRRASDAQLWRMLEAAELTATIAALPQGLDSLIGHDGVRLSGGQRQRLAIARALLAQPRMIILDEATSALDDATEARVHANLRACLQQVTMLIIAHRPSALAQGDRHYFLEAGHLQLTGG